MIRVIAQKIHIELSAWDGFQYGVALFNFRAILQNTLEKFKSYLTICLNSQGLIYQIAGNRLIITATSFDKSNTVEQFL